MHNQPYVGRIALCKRKKLLKSGEIRDFYGTMNVQSDVLHLYFVCCSHLAQPTSKTANTRSVAPLAPLLRHCTRSKAKSLEQSDVCPNPCCEEYHILYESYFQTVCLLMPCSSNCICMMYYSTNSS